MPHTPVMRATPLHASKACRVGNCTAPTVPKRSDGQNVWRYRVGPPPESHTAEEIEQAESLVVTLHEVLPTPRRRAGVAGCVQDGLRPGP